MLRATALVLVAVLLWLGAGAALLFGDGRYLAAAAVTFFISAPLWRRSPR